MRRRQVIKIIIFITIFWTLTSFLGVTSKFSGPKFKSRRRNSRLFSKWTFKNSDKDLDTSASNQSLTMSTAPANQLPPEGASFRTPLGAGIQIGERPVLQPVFIPINSPQLGLDVNQLQNMINLYRQLQSFALHHQELHSIADNNHHQVNPVVNLMAPSNLVHRTASFAENEDPNHLLRQFLLSPLNAALHQPSDQQVALDPIRSALYLPGANNNNNHLTIPNPLIIDDGAEERSLATESSFNHQQFNEWNNNFEERKSFA